MEVGTRGIFLLIPESEKNHSAGENVVGDGAWCRNVEHGESQPDSQPAGEPRSVSFQFPAASSPMGFSAHRLTHPQPRVFDDIPIYSQLLAGTLYAELLFSQSIRLC